MKREELEEVTKIVRHIAGFYKRKCFYHSFRALENEGWVAALLAVKDYDNTRGVTLGQHVFFRVRIALGRYSWKRDLPVTCTNYCTEKLTAETKPMHAPPQIIYKLPAEDTSAAGWWEHLEQEVRQAADHYDPSGVTSTVLLDGEDLHTVCKNRKLKMAKARKKFIDTRKKLTEDTYIRELFGMENAR